MTSFGVVNVVPKMLIAENEYSYASALADWFSQESYDVDVVFSGGQAAESLRSNRYNIAIMESKFPDIDGFAVCHNYRKTANSATPIVILASHKSTCELERSIDSGADDFICRPVEMRELSAKVRALLRRPNFQGEVLRVGSLEVDLNSGTASRAGKTIHLSPMEFRLLEFLLRHPSQIFSSEALLSRLWLEREPASTETLKTHIKTLRQKIDIPGNQSLIVTVHGRGYKLEDELDPQDEDVFFQ
jgi:DNA-binding response OmpR family regulator